MCQIRSRGETDITPNSYFGVQGSSPCGNAISVYTLGVDQITIQYVDFSDPTNPQTRAGVFYVDSAPTQYSSIFHTNLKGFTPDGKPVRINGLRMDEETSAYYALTVEFIERPSIFPEPEPEPVQADASDFCDAFFTPGEAPAPAPEPTYAWPASACWGVLGISRERLPEAREEAQNLVEQQFRDRALQTHPDHGGDGQNFRRVLAARTEARRILSSLVWA